ncbi:WD40 repeat-like protein, partial [Schizopora paradoxa]
LCHELAGHSAGIECMAISMDGLTLSSSNNDTFVIIWNIKTGEAVQKINKAYHVVISSIVWIVLNDSTEPAFVFGCADGSLHLYKKQTCQRMFEFIAMETCHNSAVESLAFNPIHCRLASIGGDFPQVWKLTAAGTMALISNSTEQKPLVARNIFFCDDGASIVVCYLESQELMCLSIEPWAVKWSKTIPTRIGNACFCSNDGSYIYIANLTNIVDQYKFPTLERVQSFPHAIEIKRPVQVSTTALGAWVVAGGDAGFACIFDRRTGQLVQRLDHSKCEYIYTCCTVISALSDSCST